MSELSQAAAAGNVLGRRAQLPRQRCDIVMKGGITSGIVYPKAVARLAEEYAFKNIGGTSAGAIAAVAAAAAEYGYQTGKTDAFERLAGVPDELGRREGGGNSRLLLLFQPQPDTRWIMAALLAFLRDPKRCLILKGAGALAAICARFWWQAAIAIAVGLALIVVPLAIGGAWMGVLPVIGVMAGLAAWKGCKARWLRIVLALAAVALILAPLIRDFGGLWLPSLMALSGALATLVLFGVIVGLPAAKAADRAIAANACGVCSGMEGALGDNKTPLTVWMADVFDELGGHGKAASDSRQDRPVTFGDLWGTADSKAERRINLQTMTANLNRGRPYTLPFEGPDEKRFWFDADELARLFPKRIVDWLVARSNPAMTETAAAVQQTRPRLYPLPAPADLPIVVAARMSMSFPVLLSAIPLYEYRGTPKGTPDRPDFRKCWFSDGGMCSNLPVHLFDSVLPRWPTFAINLRYFKTGDRELAQRVWLPADNKMGLQEFPHAFDPDSAGTCVKGLFGAIKNAMQNWVDTSQVRMPGYRDRVAHIHLDENEGGMNLNMEKKLIDDISDYGRRAADLFIDHFKPGSKITTNWDNHRWIRFRAGMAMLEEKLFTASRALQPGTAQAGFGSYTSLIAGYAASAYPWQGVHTRRSAIVVLNRLRRLIRDWQKDGRKLRARTQSLEGTDEIFLDNSPRPRGYYRVMPHF